jgi:tripartite ATP-independent transporter DctP family solute receptor
MKNIAIVLSCLFGVAAQAVTLKLGHALPPTHPVHIALEKMAEIARTKSNGEIDISISHSSLMGNERELIQKVQRGFIAMTKTSTSLLESFVPDYGTFSLPYLFRNETHRWKVLDGAIGKNFLQLGNDKGLMGLAYLDAGTRSFYLRKGPIKKVEDLKGLKVRIQNSETMKRVMLSMGALPTPMGFEELYTGLGTGVVDAAENNIPSVFDARHYEVAKYYSVDEHSATPDVILISTQVWKRLSPTNQQILAEAASEAALLQRSSWKATVEKDIEIMKKAGLQVNSVDKASFANAVQSLYDEIKASKKPEEQRIALHVKSIQDTK